MARLLSDTHEFADGFVGECYKRGFTEEQTAELLKTACRQELVSTNDDAFAEGFMKQAGMLGKQLGKIPVHARALLGLGAAGAGAVMPAFYRPAPFDPYESTGSGVSKGLIAGGLLGGGLGLAGAAFSKGRGGRTNLRNFIREGNPFPKVYDNVTGKSIPGARYTELLNPVRAGIKALAKPQVGKGTAKGMFYGGAFGAGIGLRDQLGLGGGTGFSPLAATGNYGDALPAAASGGASGGTAAKNTDSIYSIPKSIEDYYSKPEAGAAAGAGAGMAATALNVGKTRVNEIDQRLNTMRGFLKDLSTTNPNDRLRALDIQREINRLSRERDSAVQALNKSVSGASNNIAQYKANAANDYALANRLKRKSEKAFNRHMGLAEADGSSWWDLIKRPAAELFNSRERAESALNDQNMYEQVMNRAQGAMDRDFTFK